LRALLDSRKNSILLLEKEHSFSLCSIKRDDGFQFYQVSYFIFQYLQFFPQETSGWLLAGCLLLANGVLKPFNFSHRVTFHKAIQVVVDCLTETGFQIASIELVASLSPD
jgi:hypothetical protein